MFPSCCREGAQNLIRLECRTTSSLKASFVDLAVWRQNYLGTKLSIFRYIVDCETGVSNAHFVNIPETVSRDKWTGVLAKGSLMESSKGPWSPGHLRDWVFVGGEDSCVELTWESVGSWVSLLYTSSSLGKWWAAVRTNCEHLLYRRGSSFMANPLPASTTLDPGPLCTSCLQASWWRPKLPDQPHWSPCQKERPARWCFEIKENRTDTIGLSSSLIRVSLKIVFNLQLHLFHPGPACLFPWFRRSSKELVCCPSAGQAAVALGRSPS